MATRKT